METLLIITAAALWGCGTGVLIPRPAYRLSVPPEEPWRSACPAGHPLTGIGNGWLGRARCAAGEAYGPGTLSIASATAVICALLAAATGARPELVVWLLLAPAAVLLATVDFTAHRLPDVLTLPLTAAALVLLGIAALLPGAGGSWTSALLGSLILGASYFALFLISTGFGFGDVKLALVLGAALVLRGGRGPRQPGENAQASHVRPGLLRTPPDPHPHPAMRRHADGPRRPSTLLTCAIWQSPSPLGP